MIDNFSLGITHVLMLYACWLMLRRPDLDSETPQEKGFRRTDRDG